MGGKAGSVVEDMVSMQEDLSSIPSFAPPTKKKKRKFNFNLQLITPEGMQMLYYHVDGAEMTRI